MGQVVRRGKEELPQYPEYLIPVLVHYGFEDGITEDLGARPIRCAFLGGCPHLFRGPGADRRAYLGHWRHAAMDGPGDFLEHAGGPVVGERVELSVGEVVHRGVGKEWLKRIGYAG